MVDFSKIDRFTQGYIEALFFTEEASGVTTEEWQATDEHDEGSIPGDVGIEDIDDASFAEILKDCKDFQETYDLALQEAYAVEGDRTYDPERAGYDFWLTRNRHGVGFWDRGLGAVGDVLTTAANACGSVDVYLGDDGKVYLG